MKECPKCNLSLPSEAHFCPKCMYEYPRAERQGESGKPVNKKKRIIAISVLVYIIFSLFFLGNMVSHILENREMPVLDEEIDEESQAELDQIFRTGETSTDNPAIIYDFKDELFSEFDSVAQILGAEIKEPYLDGEYTIHEFEWAAVHVSQDMKVKSIYIDYLNAKEDVIEQYGIHGINGKTNRSEVMKMLGYPAQNYGDEEWYFRFDGEIGMPSLRVLLNEEGIVTGLQYYTLQ